MALNFTTQGTNSIPALIALARSVCIGAALICGFFATPLIYAQGNALRSARSANTNDSQFNASPSQTTTMLNQSAATPNTLSNSSNYSVPKNPAATQSELGSALFRQLESTIFKETQATQTSPSASAATVLAAQSHREDANHADQIFHDPQVAPAAAQMLATGSEGVKLAVDALPTTVPTDPSVSKPLTTESLAAASDTSPEPFQGFNSLQLGETVKKLAINTGLVLMVAVAFILITKKNKTGIAKLTKPQKSAAVCQVEQTINLGGKSILKIVRIGTQQLAIAMDSGGIKSVVSLTSGFEDAMDSVSEPETPPNLDHLLEIMKHLDLGREKSKA